MLEKLFKLKENNTSVRVEIIGGVTTFMTMAYIIALNPNLLTNFAVGTPLWNAVFLATVISAGIGTLLMAFMANKPFALAPGMGLNSYFATVVTSIAVAGGMTYEESFPAALSIILISGVLFTILTLCGVREKIVDAIPKAVRLGIPAGIGLMLVNVGLTTNAGIYTADGGPFYMLSNFFSAGPSATLAAMGPEGYHKMVLYVITFFIGLFTIAVLSHKNVKGSVLLGMVISAVCYWIGSFILGENPFASLATANWLPPFSDMFHTTFFKFDFKNLFDIGVFSAIMTIISFCMVDMFDTIGTLYGTAKKAGMLDENDKLPGMNRAMLSDSLATCVGSVTGTSTVTTFIESASGVGAGARTGLASVITGVLFLACMFISPLAALIPAPATSAALVYVGVLMMGSLKEVDYNDVSQTVPVVLLLIFMMGTSGIGNGIGIGLIAYTIIKVCTGKIKEVSPVTFILSALFICKFFITF